MSKIRSARLLLAFVAAALIAAAHPSLASSPDRVTDRPVLLRLKPADLRAALSSLAAEGYDIPGVNLETGTVDIIGTESDVATFAARGIPTTVVQFLDNLPEVDPKYLDPGEVESRLQAIQSTYPDIAHLYVIGQTVEGRPYYAMKISDNVQEDEDEPSIFFIGEHHAREVMTPEITMDLIGLSCPTSPRLCLRTTVAGTGPRLYSRCRARYSNCSRTAGYG